MRTKVFKEILTKDFLAKEYIDNKKSIQTIAKEVGCDANLVFRTIKFFNLKRKDVYIGKKISKLLVLEKGEYVEKHKRFMYKCQCDCGNIKYVLSSYLHGNQVQSCGCLTKRIGSDNPCWNGYGEISGRLFKSIEQGAKRRKLEFNITKEFLWNLFLKQERKCALSGVDLKFAPGNHSVENITASLDRIDSSKGYTEDNVQWVHKYINVMKMFVKQDEFIFLACKIAEKQGYINKDNKIENYDLVYNKRIWAK